MPRRDGHSSTDPYAPVTAWDLGRLSESASVADDALFSFLSTARSHCRLNITDAQLFGPERAQKQTAREIGSASLSRCPPLQKRASRELRSSAISALRSERPGNDAPTLRD